MPRSTAYRVVSRTARASVEAKLKLSEALVACDDEAACAALAVAWLAEWAGVDGALLALVDGDDGDEGARLVGTAAYGARPPTSDFVVDLDDDRNPLVAALSGTDPVIFSATVARERTRLGHLPLGDRGFLAVPLPMAHELPRAGLLLVSPVSARVSTDASWAANLIGRTLLRLRERRTIGEAERRTTRERTLLHHVINAVTDPVLLTDTEGRLIIANTRADALFASTSGESEGRRRAIALNNMLLSAALSRRAIEGEAGSVARRELLLVDPADGSDLLFELLSTVATDTREGTGIVSVLRNVTDLRRATEEIESNYGKLRMAEAQVRAERDRLDLIIDSVADPILVTDPAGAIVMMNAPAERLFTGDPDSTPDVQRIVRANDAHFSSFVSNVFLSGPSQMRVRGEIGLVDPGTGAAIPVEAISGKVVSEHREVTAVVTILHDRTEAMEKARLYAQIARARDELEDKVQQATAELVRHNELLRRQAIELEQASNLKSQFLANMSHEFRTPLNAILGYTAMLLQGVSGDLSERQRKSMTRVDSNAKHLLAIINDILDISRIEAGRMPLHVADFEMRDLVGEVMAELEPIIARSRLTVVRHLDPDLPTIRSDRQKVKQIVLNLLSNALKFTPEGSVTVSVHRAHERGEIDVAVVDTGIGIAPEDQDNVFEDFRQADNSPTREYGGAGLGLSICRRLAGALGGRITLKSTLGEGSTFTLHLPFDRGDAR